MGRSEASLRRLLDRLRGPVDEMATTLVPVVAERMQAWAARHPGDFGPATLTPEDWEALARAALGLDTEEREGEG